MNVRQALERLAAVTVGDCMTRDPITVSTEESCSWALQVMSAANVHHLPVLEGGRLVGIVTTGDVYRRGPAGLRSAAMDVPAARAMLEHARVAGVMSYRPTTIGTSAGLRDAIDLMLQHRIGCLPVMAESGLVGVLTHEDVLRALGGALSDPPANDSGNDGPGSANNGASRPM